MYCGIHWIATIATIAGEWFPFDRYDRHDRRDIIFSIPAIAIAATVTIAAVVFPYDRYDRRTRFSAIAAIIWKPGLRLQLRGEQNGRGLKKQARKHRRDSKMNGSEIPTDVGVNQSNKRLARC